MTLNWEFFNKCEEHVIFIHSTHAKLQFLSSVSQVIFSSWKTPLWHKVSPFNYFHLQVRSSTGRASHACDLHYPEPVKTQGQQNMADIWVTAGCLFNCRVFHGHLVVSFCLYL